MEIGAGGNLRLLPRRRQEDRSTIPIASDPFGSRNRQAKTPLTAGLRMAVPVGFEPTEGVNPHTLSRRAPLAARTRHRRLDYLQRHRIEKPMRQLSPAEHCAPAEIPRKQSERQGHLLRAFRSGHG